MRSGSSKTCALLPLKIPFTIPISRIALGSEVNETPLRISWRTLGGVPGAPLWSAAGIQKCDQLNEALLELLAVC